MNNLSLSVFMPVIISFLISVVFCPILIPFLRKLKFGQTEREEGPQSHLKKNGTPTMGGLVILASILLTSLIYIGKFTEILPVLFMTLGFGLIGFLDDYIKVVKKRSLGLTPLQKMALQFVVTGVFIYYYFKIAGLNTSIKIPFVSGDGFVMPTWLFIIFVFIVVLGTVNGVNFTDGLDGLASGVTVIVATFFTIAALSLNPSMTPITGAVVGSLLGFLLFNTYPARVFMGDTGSLALGGFVSSIALMLHMPLFIVIIGLIYLVEVLSVILQVGYFKLTHGKRIFKMAPIHHHFELCGYSETQVVAAFSIVTALLCLVGIMAL
ncbi:phospho-N-acetylmuramoyl-pentapeptide-transferase [Clostridium sp. AF36-4]|uniref:phospho-N-acetylmuramoyl-pentapeptide- transferase n=1 Tax=Clostridium sp. AF36-4 TaxID=2293015 RepID=UPI000E3F6C1B|nr:phospho-N-acetylmuramoyl-pentapeptide-transferase [Clostridium sp. AF36-4]RGF57307.1 phospho-N-acetylmuramoyl-pentapeptide-transferase [Clostridium sp. AF36-4]